MSSVDGPNIPVRALLGVGYYRSQSAPDLALYLGESCYPGLTSLWCRLGMGKGPYVDHCDIQFEGSFEISVTPSIKGRDSTREAHVRRARVIREVWSTLACPARGFAKSPVTSEAHQTFTRSYIENWRTEPGKGKRTTVPPFEHSTLSRAVAEGEHGLHMLTGTDRQALLSHLEGFGMDAHQVASVLGCSVKTVQSWRRKSNAEEPLTAPEFDAMINRAIDAGIKARDLYELAKQDLITRADLRLFLEAALASMKRGAEEEVGA